MQIRRRIQEEDQGIMLVFMPLQEKKTLDTFQSIKQWERGAPQKMYQLLTNLVSALLMIIILFCKMIKLECQKTT
ncbi:MAG: hypothetical protein ACJ706_00350 [Nitrososphaeraceae archaeon]